MRKNQLITGADLFHRGNKFALTATDPLWLKYAKSAIICDQQHDFPTSHRYSDGAIAELEKLAKQGHRTARYNLDETIARSLSRSVLNRRRGELYSRSQLPNN